MLITCIIAGGATALLCIIIMQLNAGYALKANRITLNAFNALEKDNLEICYSGHPKFEEILDFYK